MTEENPKVDREGIHIDADLAQQLHLEEELDSNVTGLYYFPSPERRRISAWILLGFGLLALFTIPSGWMVAIGFALIAGERDPRPRHEPLHLGGHVAHLIILCIAADVHCPV